MSSTHKPPGELSNCRRVGEGEDGQELNSQRDVSCNSVRVNVNRYVEAPLEMRGLFLFQISTKTQPYRGLITRCGSMKKG